MSRLGIDFGTSYCTMAALDSTNRPVTIRSREGLEKIPTVVFWDAEGNHDVGTAAVDRESGGGTYEEQKELHFRTVRSIKRNFSPQYVVPMPDGEIVKAVDVVTLVLKKLKEDAETGLFHSPVTSLCLTHPATFTAAQIDLLSQAAKNAGFKVIELLEEPIAAVIGYSSIHGFKQGGNGFLVYDLGGGTLDLAYVHHQNDNTWCIPFPPRGDAHFGGDDFDRMIYD